MDSNKILNADYLDILFDGRNKQYGGYDLRRKYSRRLTQAGIILLLALLVPVGVYALKALLGSIELEKPKPVVREVVLTEPPPLEENKPKPPPPPAEPPPPAKPTVQFTPPVIKKDEEVREEEKVVEVKKLEDASAGLETKAGDPEGIDPGIINTDPAGTGSGPVEEAPPPPQIFKYVEQMPEFNGNVNEWLGRNVRYPESAREGGTEGRTVLQFVVSEDGSVGDVTVVKGSGSSELDAEAKRAVKSMPPWKAGKQNGKAVKVYFTLPVTFKLD